MTFRLDVLVTIAKTDASPIYEREAGVSLRDLRVLRNIAHQPGLMQGELVDRCYIEKTLVSKLVTALAKRGLLKREIGATDARQVLLRLTQAGQEAVDRCEVVGRQLERAMLSVLTEDERNVFDDCIDKITSHMLLQREEAGHHVIPRMQA